MVKSKSNKLSTNYKDKGNSKLKKEYPNEALKMYNKAILFAKSKEALALAYANRSVIYLERKLYEECLLNIKWARENDYPAEKIQKLIDREAKCKRLQETEPRDPVDDPWNFLKLSHPPNPNIPFIIDCLEMKKTEKYGRGIYATRDISAGDILSIEESFIQCALTVDDAEIYICANCLKTNMMNLIPCSKTASFMFCSNDCREKAYKKVEGLDRLVQRGSEFNQEKVYADIEEKFGTREKLLEFLETLPDIKKLDYSVFDFDWTNKDDPEYGINQIKCFLSFAGCFDTIEDGQIPFPETPKNLTKGNKLVADLIKHACGVLGLVGKQLRYGFLGVNFANLLNHSCDSNVQRTQVQNKILVYATKPIKMGEQLFECYRMRDDECHFLEMPIELRRFFTTNMYNFTCDCHACEKNLGPNQAKIHNESALNSHFYKSIKACEVAFDSGSLKLVIDQWKDNNDYITKHHNKTLSKDVHLMKQYCSRLIDQISYLATYPFKM